MARANGPERKHMKPSSGSPQKQTRRVQAKSDYWSTITFKFTPTEKVLLDKISRQLFKSQAERRFAFLFLARWMLAHWDELHPRMRGDLRYAVLEGLSIDQLCDHWDGKMAALAQRDWRDK